MNLHLEPYTLSAYGLSDTGLVRKNNEDAWGSLPELHLFVLADGMGGHQAGEVAAREAIHFFLGYIKELFENEKQKTRSVQQAAELIRLAICRTNRFVYDLSQTHELLGGMGTTFLCLCFHDDSVIYAHVGDSRIYRKRTELLQQLTSDHSLLCELLERGGSIPRKQVEEYSYKNVLTKAIGTEPFVEPTINMARVSINDLYLLCSDGLSDLLTNPEINDVLSMDLTVEEKVRTLIALAKRKGGYDNVTAVLVEVNRAHENLS